MDGRSEPKSIIGTAEIARSASVYERIRDDIVHGRLASNARLNVSALAKTYGISTNPVREALQQLRGEGFVVISPNRGARVRPMDEDFVRNVHDIIALLEPYLIRWFVEVATAADIQKLESIQQQIEDLGFKDRIRNTALDSEFHRTIYGRHFNRHAFELWWKHREIVMALSRDTSLAQWRGEEIIREHRQVIEAIRNHDADRAATIIATHVQGSGQHLSLQFKSRNGWEPEAKPLADPV